VYLLYSKLFPDDNVEENKLEHRRERQIKQANRRRTRAGNCYNQRASWKGE